MVNEGREVEVRTTNDNATPRVLRLRRRWLGSVGAHGGGRVEKRGVGRGARKPNVCDEEQEDGKNILGRKKAAKVGGDVNNVWKKEKRQSAAEDEDVPQRLTLTADRA